MSTAKHHILPKRQRGGAAFFAGLYPCSYVKCTPNMFGVHFRDYVSFVTVHLLQQVASAFLNRCHDGHQTGLGIELFRQRL